MLGLGLGIFKKVFSSAVKLLFGEYFYNFTEQSINGFVGAGEGETIISDYLTAQGSSNTNYFQSELLSTSSSSNVKKLNISFYTPVAIPADDATIGIRHVLLERADTNTFGILLGRVSTVTPLDTDLEIISFIDGANIWYIDSTSVAEISIGLHTLSIEWDTINTRYNFIYDGTSYAGKFTSSATQNAINNFALRIMRRSANLAAGSLYPPAGAYVSRLSIYNTSDEFIYDFLNKYGANNTTYEQSGFTTTRYVGDATKRVTTSVPSQYRIENSSPNKPSFVFGNALQFDGVNDYVSIPNLTLTSNFVYSAWVFVKTGEDAVLLENTASGSNNILISTNFSYVRFRNVDFATQKTIPITPANWENRWNHVYIYRNSGTVYLYQDGNLIGSVAYPENNIFNTLGASNAWVRADSFIYDECGIALNSNGSGADASSLYNGGSGDYFNNYYTPTAYWRFNENDGDTTLVDETGNYNGTLNNFNFDGTDGFVRAGYYKELSPRTGVAADFDGTAYVDTGVNLGTLSIDFVIHMVIKHSDTLVSDARILSANNTTLFSIRFNGSSQLDLWYDGWDVMHDINLDNNYHTHTFVFSNSTVVCYLDGVLTNTINHTKTVPVNANLVLAHELGAGVAGTKGIFSCGGLLILEGNINATQIAQLTVRPELTKNYLVNTVGIDWANVAAFYPLTEGGGDIAYDLSDNKNHGTWTNPAYVTGLSTGRQLGLQNVSQYLKLDGVDDELTLTTYTSPTANDGFSIVYKFIPYGLSPLAAEQHVLSTSSTNVSQFYYRINNLAIKLNSSYTVFITPTTNFVNGAINTVVITFDSGNLSDVTINGETPSSTTNTSPGARTYQIDTLFEFAPSTGNGFEDIPLSFQVYEGVLSSDEIDYINADVNNDVRDFNGFSLTEGFVFTNKGDYSNWEKVGISGDTFAGTPETITLPEVETIANVPYDTFGLECNSKNIIVTGGEVEETFVLRGNGNLRYDGHAGSYTDVKQIQFMIKPTSSNHAYVLTDEENNRVVYINSNQVVSDFGLNSVYINDIETNVVLTDVWQQVTIEFYGAYTFEKLFIGSSAVPDAFEEFGIDKLNIVKNSSFNLLETFDFIVNADNQLVTDGEDITTIYNAGNDKSIRIISSSTSILDKPQLSTDNRFGGSPYITMKSGSYFTLNNAFNFKSNFTIFWVLNNNSARPLVQMSSSTGSPLSFQSANNLGIYIYTPTGVFLSTYDEEIETILTITYNGTTITLYQNGVFKGSKFSGVINSFDHIGRHAYEGDYYLATLAIDNRLLNNEELNSVGSELATKYGITWNNI